MSVTERTSVRTFLIADIRGYSRYTEECGDEAAAALSKRFAEIVDDDVEAHDGELVEMRGDEALVVFTSARQAIRAAVDLQAQFQEAARDFDIPLRVGIGIDSGEAVQLEDGSFRGAALNVAARLCGRASGGEVIISDSTSRLAGRLGGLHYSDGGRVRLKNIPEPIHVYKVYSELDARPTNRWTVMFFGKERRSLSWRLALLVTLIAAGTALAVVMLTAGEGAPAERRSIAAAGASRGGPGDEPGVGRPRGGLGRLPPADHCQPRGRRDGRLRARDRRPGSLGDLPLPERPCAYDRLPERARQPGGHPTVERQVQRPCLGRRERVEPRPGEAGRPVLLLLRRQRRRHRVDARAWRPGDSPGHPRHGPRGRERPRGPDALVGPVAPRDRQGRLARA